MFLCKVWHSVEKCGMCGGECGIIPHPLVGYVIKLQLVVQRFAVNAQQLCSAALVVSRLPQGFDDLMLLCLLIAERDTDDGRCGFFQFIQFVDSNEFALCQQGCTTYHILHLSQIARPGVFQ